jgi:glycosyltransferase involved in cell wall biosynthesis
MRIGIDGCCWSNRRGFGRFTRELVTQMIRDRADHEFTLVVDKRTAEECTLPGGCRLEVVATREQPTRAASAEAARRLTDVWRLSWAASAGGCDVFFFPAVYSYFPLLRPIPTLVTFHDAIAETLPDLIFPGRRARLFWKAKTWMARRQADRILTVSENARAVIAATFGYPAHAIHVITEAPAAEFKVLDDRRAIPRVLAEYGIPSGLDLLLYVGGISPHKNLQGLLRALARMDRGSAHLVIVGDHQEDSFYGCYRQLLGLRRELGLEDRVTFTGFVPNDRLVVLYNAATVFVLPSLAEGFGLPAVEAMACGLPVAASRRGSLPEVVGTAGVLFDPLDPAAMASTLSALLADAERRQRLRAAGLARARGLSWGAAAARTVGLLEEMAHGAA